MPNSLAAGSWLEVQERTAENPQARRILNESVRDLAVRWGIAIEDLSEVQLYHVPREQQPPPGDLRAKFTAAIPGRGLHMPPIGTAHWEYQHGGEVCRARFLPNEAEHSFQRRVALKYKVRTGLLRLLAVEESPDAPIEELTLPKPGGRSSRFLPVIMEWNGAGQMVRAQYDHLVQNSDNPADVSWETIVLKEHSIQYRPDPEPGEKQQVRSFCIHEGALQKDSNSLKMMGIRTEEELKAFARDRRILLPLSEMTLAKPKGMKVVLKLMAQGLRGDGQLPSAEGSVSQGPPNLRAVWRRRHSMRQLTAGARLAAALKGDPDCNPEL
jgi:hypothetical protein